MARFLSARATSGWFTPFTFSPIEIARESSGSASA
jgi:hypothetical protein